MYTFISMSAGEKRMNGYFDDNGENVSFFRPEEANPFRPKTKGIVIDLLDYKLEDWLGGTSRQHIYRYNAAGEQEDLFTEWKDHRQLGNIFELPDGSLFVMEVTATAQNTAYRTDPDGSHREVVWTGGFAYGMSLSPDRTMLAYHLTAVDNEFSPPGCEYAMNVYDFASGERRLIHAREGHLMFGSNWTPDGKYVVFQDCFCREDPAHYFSDICIATPDGSEVRYLTEGQSAYFGTTYGSAEIRGGGSNYPVPLSDHEILYALRSPGAHPDADYDRSRGNHRESAMNLSMAKGGTSIFLHDIRTDTVTPVTSFEEGKWDFRPCVTFDRKHIFYTSVRNGETSAIRFCRLDGTEDRFITKGYEGGNADHAHCAEEL